MKSKISHLVGSVHTAMCEKYKKSLVNYLNASDIYAGADNWDCVEISPFGRCMIAKRDVKANEIIFCDKPLFFGPRQQNYEKVKKKRFTYFENLFLFLICFSYFVFHVTKF